MELQRSGAMHFLPGDLSRVPAFQLGPLRVDPPTRSVSCGAQRATLEPRIMQVLVALGREPGKVLSRDDLIALCWDGRIVGDDAINRAVSRLRHVLADLSGGGVRLETITKVGFRIVAEEAREAAAPAANPNGTAGTPSRRGLIAGAAGAIALGGAAWYGWSRWTGPDPRAVALVERGMVLQRTAEPGAVEQAVAFFKQAVAIDPGYADGWGALAQGYLHSFDGFSARDKSAVEALLRSAARRALALDPEQPDAHAALVMIEPLFGNYAKMDVGTAGLVERFPDYWYAVASRGRLLRQTGRLRKALPPVARVVEIDPMLPGAWAYLALTHALAGDLQQADLTLDQAQQRWPAHGFLWLTRQDILLDSGRFEAAAAVALDPRQRPDYVPREAAQERAAVAGALAEGNRRALAAARDRTIAGLAKNALAAQSATPRLALMGFSGDALDVLVRLFRAAATDRNLARQINLEVLYRAPILALHEDPRHGEALRLAGLESYWRQSGERPDFVQL